MAEESGVAEPAVPTGKSAAWACGGVKEEAVVPGIGVGLSRSEGT